MSEAEQLEKAIAALEAQRTILGDAVVDAALAPLRDKLASLQPQPAAEQRKLVTVLFADLVGFTAMSEQMDPEDVREVINAYFSRWTASIEQFGGSVEKFIGDAVMAVFGLNLSREDDPENAIRAALSMKEALDGLNEELERTRSLRLAMRVGVHTGPVVVSFLGERKGQDFVVVGDTVNVASRIQSIAPENGILISHDTYRHVRGIFLVQALQPVRVKGKAEAVQVYQVQRAKPRAFRITNRGVEGIETQMVGRQSELKRLQEALSAALEDSELQMITVVGDPGLGKTRLLFEFDNWVELLPEVFRYFKGRATPSMQHLPYSLMRDLISFRFRIQDSDPPEAVRRKIQTGIAEAYPSEGEPAEEVLMRAHFIGQLFGFDFSDSPHLRGARDDARQFRNRALTYLSEYFQAVAARRPIVLLLEDIHWADDSSLEVVNFLAGALQKQRILVLCAARPTLFERYPLWGDEQPFHTRLDLQPLTRRDSRRLVDEILQKVDLIPSDLRELVVSNAEGNPYYMEELIKMFIEDGVIVKGDENWHVDLSRLSSIRVPTTLTGVLQARFDSLKPEERVLLQRASVIGRIFWEQALAFLTRHADTSSQARWLVEQPTTELLNRLQAREMIYRHDQSAFEDTEEYLFKHALLRDVTYESVLKRERRIYHAQAARWLAEVTRRYQRSNEYAALIADHYEQAGETNLAAEWYRQAGLHAATQYASREAIRCLSRALELSPEANAAEKFELLLAREKSYDLLGQREPQEADLETLAALAERLGDKHRAQVLLERSSLALRRGEYASAIPTAQQAITLAQARGLAEIETTATIHWGASLWRLGDYEAGRVQLEQALAIARSRALPALEAESLRNLGVIAETLGDYANAREHYQEAMRLYTETGNRRGVGMLLNDLGVLFYYQSDLGQARQYLERSLHAREEIGDRAGECSVLNNLGLVTFTQGDHPAALQYYERELNLARQIGDLEGEATGLSGLGFISLLWGDLEKAASYIRQSALLFDQIGDKQGMAEAQANQGLLAIFLEDFTASLEHTQRALEQALEIGTLREVSYAHHYMGRALLGLNRLEEAEQAFRSAKQVRNELGHRMLMIESQAGLSLSLARLEKHEAAREEVDDVCAYLAHHTLEGIDDALTLYLFCYETLLELNDPRAGEILQKAQQLLEERLSNLPSPHQKRNFMENVPTHRQILAAWQGYTHAELIGGSGL